MKTKIKITINDQYRVLWKKNEIFGAIKTLTQKKNIKYIKELYYDN
jgi:hypothetical protein